MWQQVLLELLLLPCLYGDYQSLFTFSSPGMEFNGTLNLQLLDLVTKSSMRQCSLVCHQLPSCRTFDYDSISQRCRLFEADSTTGSIIPSSSPVSTIGTLRIDASIYTPFRNQPCSICEGNRYEVCSTTTSRCQCPPRTYWTGSICALQLLENGPCAKVDACRLDLNLTCPSNCYGEFNRCLRSFINYTLPMLPPGYGVTVAGACNGTNSTNQTTLSAPADVMVLPNGTMLVANGDGRLLGFPSGSRMGQMWTSFSNWPTFMYYDNRTDEIYVSVYSENLVHVLPSNRTIPPSGDATASCSVNRTSRPVAIIGDSAGNMYVTSNLCHWVTMWTPNATTGIVVAGLNNGNFGSVANALNAPYGLALDEANSYLYVSDRNNHRIQRFTLGGSRNGTTVAGTGVNGPAADQLNVPTEIYISNIDRSLYIVDNGNHRIQKWSVNANAGVTVVGSSTGQSGGTPLLLNSPFALAFDPSETSLYVSDTQNKRIQRFSLT